MADEAFKVFSNQFIQRGIFAAVAKENKKERANAGGILKECRQIFDSPYEVDYNEGFAENREDLCFGRQAVPECHPEIA